MREGRGRFRDFRLGVGGVVAVLTPWSNLKSPNTKTCTRALVGTETDHYVEAGLCARRIQAVKRESLRIDGAQLATGLCHVVALTACNSYMCGGGLLDGHAGNVLAVDHILMSGGKRCDP